MDLSSSGIKLGVTFAKLVRDKVVNVRAARSIAALASGEKDLDQACVDSSEIFRFTLLLDSLNKASTHAKAKLLKDIYLAFDGDLKTESVDDLFFEVVSILSELSDRELRLLYLLEFYHQHDIKGKRNDPRYSMYFEKISSGFIAGSPSDSFYYFVSDKMQIEVEYVAALMKRLERSGLIFETSMDGNAKFQEYEPTVLYRDIKQRIIVAMENSYGVNASFGSGVF